VEDKAGLVPMADDACSLVLERACYFYDNSVTSTVILNTGSDGISTSDTEELMCSVDFIHSNSSLGCARNRLTFTLRHVVLCLHATLIITYAAAVVFTSDGVSVFEIHEPVLQLLRRFHEVVGVCCIVICGSRRVRPLLSSLALFLRFVRVKAYTATALELSHSIQ
jgi:hypothetical protein